MESAWPERVRLFGVRHHGPGCARSLERALDALDPAAVLIEGPADANAALAFAAAPGMRPPLALLAYAAEDPAAALFVPFSEWSPEWRAIQWALARQRPVRFIDLPAAVRVAELRAAGKPPEAVPAEDDEARDIPADPDTPPPDAPQPDGPETAEPLPRRDPLAYLAALAGYEDSEAWWNNIVEQASHGPDVFAAIESALTALRDAVEQDHPVTDSSPESEKAEALRERRREAHMRVEVACAVKEVEGPIAVIVGAWHVPALRRPARAADDRQLLKGISIRTSAQAKIVVTWVPWTDTRLAAASGYGAGVISPGWYRHLWGEMRKIEAGDLDRRRMIADWQTRVASVLRESGRPVSTASVIEAARLSEALAGLRDLAVPGLPEMRDGSLAVLCEGEAVPLRLVEARLVVGTEVGEVDESVPQTPLQADLTRQQKRLRLKPEALEQEISLDLRTEAGLEKSILLHRLTLIDVPWGRLTEAGASRGTFRERWTLAWAPELSVRLVEALAWGTTVAQAAAGRATAASDAQPLSELSTLVGQCLLADLPEAARIVIGRLQAAAVQTADVSPLIEAVPPLAGILRYGTARRIPTEELALLVATLTEQVCIGLVHACRQLDEAAAQALRVRLGQLDQALLTLDDAQLDRGRVNQGRLAADWEAALRRLADDDAAAMLLRGYATRLLHDRGRLADGDARMDGRGVDDVGADGVALHLSRALSPSVPAREAGEWLDGFLAGAGQLLLHDEALFGAVDAFLVGLDEDAFVALLPMLRRSFAGFDAMERRRLLETVRGGRSAKAESGTAGIDEAAFAEALPLLRTILGLGS